MSAHLLEAWGRLVTARVLYRGISGVVIPDGEPINASSILAAIDRHDAWNLGIHWSSDRAVSERFSRMYEPAPVPGVVVGPKGEPWIDTAYTGPRGTGVSVLLEVETEGEHSKEWEISGVQIPEEVETTLAPGTDLSVVAVSWWEGGGWVREPVGQMMTASKSVVSPEQLAFMNRVRDECQQTYGDAMVCREVTQALHEEYGWEVEGGSYQGPGYDIRPVFRPPYPGHKWMRMSDGTILDVTHDQYEPGLPLVIVPPDDPRQSWYVPKTAGLVTASNLPDVALALIPASDQALVSHVGFVEETGGGMGPPMSYHYEDQTIHYYDFGGTSTDIGSMVHELGHAIDHALGWISHTPQFKAVANQYPEFVGKGVMVHGRGRDSNYEEAWARGYAALYGNSTPMTWPGNDSDLALVIREARIPSGQLGSKQASTWRGFSGDEPFWTQADVVIATQMRGRQRYYEVWVEGKNFVNRPTLDEAKGAVEAKVGRPLQWERISMPKEWVEHYYFGWTSEFTDPLTIYVATL